MFKIRHFFLFIVIILTTVACDPCDELGNRLCECEDTPQKQETCKKQLELRKSHPSLKQAKDPELCKRILESGTCTCDAWRRNEVEKCGQTRGTKISND